MSRCKFCDNTGHVSLMDADGYSIAFACSCAKGDAFVQAFNAVRWNGLEYQEYRGVRYRLMFNCIIGGRNEGYEEMMNKSKPGGPQCPSTK